MRRAAAALFVLLSACDVAGGVPALALYGGAVTAAGPAGYCADPGASRPAEGFAVLAACARLATTGTGTGTDAPPPQDALLTLQVGPEGSAAVAGAEADLATLLRQPAGRALLSGGGSSDTVRVDAVERRDGLVLVHFSDSSPPSVAGLERREWRAFLDVRGRLATVGARGLESAPLGRDAGLALLAQATAALRAANPAATTANPATPDG